MKYLVIMENGREYPVDLTGLPILDEGLYFTIIDSKLFQTLQIQAIIPLPPRATEEKVTPIRPERRSKPEPVDIPVPSRREF